MSNWRGLAVQISVLHAQRLPGEMGGEREWAVAVRAAEKKSPLKKSTACRCSHFLASAPGLYDSGRQQGEGRQARLARVPLTLNF